MAENGLARNLQQCDSKLLCRVDYWINTGPSEKWLINGGVRLDSFGFAGPDTPTPPLGGSAAARAFWFSAYNLDNCVNTVAGLPVPKNSLGLNAP